MSNRVVLLPIVVVAVLVLVSPSGPQSGPESGPQPAPVDDPARLTEPLEGSEAPAPSPAVGVEDPLRALSARRLLPDLQVLQPNGLYLVDERAAGGDRRLKFATTVWNSGRGPLEVRGHDDPASGELTAVQVFHTPDGDRVEGDLVGLFEYEHRHGHLHLAAFARYELWSLAPDGAMLELVAVNDKIGFCLMDNLVVDETLVDDVWIPYPPDCEGDVQGISPGFGDIYVAELFEQDLVLNDLPDGRYALINVVNPEGRVEELRSDNNRSLAYVRLSGDFVWRE